MIKSVEEGAEYDDRQNYTIRHNRRSHCLSQC